MGKFQPGHPRVGGRKKGTPNKNRVPAQELADRLGINPYEILLLFAAGDAEALGLKKDELGPAARVKAAAEASKYVKAQMRTVDVTVREPVRVVIEDWGAKKRA